ncbi:DUF4258 domain-containing protein [Thermococcus waiotapuensis]|uniref:DUF4258 domain-containing protein n=1 Tax=Thermococcus waiotapuensis TaxID=90909 RepID=A0AAE4NWE1_9EURY|nr:DUF4258 domain-containing protein [Thermococcus waiotapuensis]MDV3104815.1 DUF4258 domain-containing protein [Thermococcus waiotapuensis]
MHFTDHALERMALYSISPEEVDRTVERPERRFFDVAMGRYVAIGEKNWHSLVVVYEKSGDETTAYRTSKIDKIVETKLSSGEVD